MHGCVTKEKYTEYNKTLRNTIRRTKLQFYQEMCNRYKSQTKKLWGLINEIAGKTNDKSNLVEYLKIDDVKEYNAKRYVTALANISHLLVRSLQTKYQNQKSLLPHI